MQVLHNIHTVQSKRRSMSKEVGTVTLPEDVYPMHVLIPNTKQATWALHDNVAMAADPQYLSRPQQQDLNPPGNETDIGIHNLQGNLQAPRYRGTQYEIRRPAA